MKKLVTFCFLVCFYVVSYSDEHVHITLPSVKPTLKEALQGVKGFTVSVVSNGREFIPKDEADCYFIDSYFNNEIAKWIGNICPDATIGNKLNYPSCATVNIKAKYNFTGETTYTAGAGWMRPDGYRFSVGSFVIILTFGWEESGYVYQYKLPAFNILQGQYGNHIVFNYLRNNICNEIFHYNNTATLQLGKLQTEWDETKLKEYFDEEGDEIEGIYESTVSNTDGRTNKYKIAVKRNIDEGQNEKYILIYLSGANYFNDINEGEIKGYLYPTSTIGLFKTSWMMAYKKFNTDYYTSFDNGGFFLINPDGDKELFLKLYPTAQISREKQSKKWQGTGFALNNGYVATNYHVANSAKSILIYQNKADGTRQEYNAKLVASDKMNDVAILKIDDPNFKGFGTIPYAIKSGVCEVGESVWALGFPMADIMGEEVKFTDGKISARSGVDGMTSVYQISVPIQHGNSGGPLFDTKGNIVGITSSGLNRDLQTENVNYAIKSTYLRLLIEDTLPMSIIPQGTAMQGQSLTTQIKLAKKFVFYIECSK